MTQLDPPPTTNPPNSRGRQFWRVSSRVILLHTIISGTPLGMAIAVGTWEFLRSDPAARTDWWRDARSDVLPLLMGLGALTLIASNGIALYITSRRARGEFRWRTTCVYLIAAAVLLGSFAMTSLSIYRADEIGSSFIGYLWLAAPALLVLTGSVLFRTSEPLKGHCHHCGYNLTGNTSGVCPECGKATELKAIAG